jgi:hypothetical protein
MKKVSMILLVFLILGNALLSQVFEKKMILKDTSISALQDRVGGFFDYNLNSYPSKFNKIGDYPSCSKDYTNGTGAGIGLGLLYEKPLSGKLALGAKLGLFTYSSKFTAIENTKVSVNGSATDGQFEYRLNASLMSIAIEPMVIYNPFDNLTISIGLNAGFLIGKTFDQEEAIVKPDGLVTFLDAQGNDTGEFIRNKLTGQQITTASTILLSAVGGLSYELPLNSKKSMLLVPEISYSYGLNNVITDGEWKINSLRAGISFKYLLQPNLPACPPGMERDADGNCVWKPCPDGKVRDANGDCVLPPCPNGKVRNEKGDCVWPPCPEGMERNEAGECIKVLTLNVNAVGVFENGVEMEKPSMRIEEFETTTMQPVLNYVFFDEGKSQIPSRYNLVGNMVETGTFDEASVIDKDNPLKLYYNNLNIIAKRLNQNLRANITLIAYNVGGSEANSPSLPHSRVNEIIDYWKNVWNISPTRITKKILEAPLILKKTDDPYIMADFRRVEIVPDSSTMEIIEPVIIRDTTQLAYPSMLQFKLNVKPVKGVDEWKLSAMQLGDVKFDTSGMGSPPIIIDWKPNPIKQKFSNESPVLDYRISVSDLNGEYRKTKMDKPIPIEWITLKHKREKDATDSTYSKFMFLFTDLDINQSIINNEKNFRNIEFDKDKSTVKITGYKDYYGEDKSKPTEAHDRATAVANYLKEKQRTIADRTKVTGDESGSILDMNLPEGRFYNKSVIIDVETKSTQKERENIKFSCCYVLYFSTPLEEAAKSNLEILQQNGIKDIRIEEWQDPLENIKYFRIRSNCFEDVRQAAALRGNHQKIINSINMNRKLTIKCDK